MRKGYRLGIISMVAFLMIGVCGCTMKQAELPQNTESGYALNERQKSILEEMELPTEYEELLPSQKRAIVAIEEMLQYAEDKYGISFSYRGYIAPSVFSPLEVERTHAYPTSGDRDRDWFTIKKTDDGYEDDYIERASCEGYASYVRDGLKEIYPDVEIKVFAEVTNTTLTEVPTDDTNYDGKVVAGLSIFVDDGSQVEENISIFKEKFVAFMNEHELYGMADVIFLYEGNIEDIAYYNYTDYLYEEYYWGREYAYAKR